MAETTGMSSLLCDPEVIEQIQSAPKVPVETFEIFDGCDEPARSFDIPTGQTFSNGVALYYTPEKVPPRSLPKAAKGRPRKRALEEEKTPEGHQGLGVLDILPVSPQIIFTHGGGRGIFQKGFMHFVKGLARSHAVLAFRRDQSTLGSKDNMEMRTAAFNYFLNDAYASVVALGGRSFGARAAARASVYSANKNLILWSYPLLRDTEFRIDELLGLSEDTRVLFIKGEKDWMAPGIVFNSIREKMKAKSWVINVKEMDHNFSTCKTEAEEESMCNALGVIAGLWLKGDASADPKNPTPWDSADGTEMDVHYDKEAQKAVWTG
ncbi:hypothetical protein Daus18300_000411 [Diaporthe australafricana]|uniref:KANL3/Tex30 alpha/beta hydrolase-like domain-containing protein n=1 Tax=Diaporthe australafricana TaxID=127596 RepID=A0ABR3Y5M9_9PEZI